MTSASPASLEAADWLSRLRAEARSHFAAAGIPKPTDEDWRQTNLLPVRPFTETLSDAVSLSPEQLVGLPLAAALPVRAVLVNGRLDPALSTLGALPPGVSLRSLGSSLSKSPDAVMPHLGRAVNGNGTPFVALNTASFADGCLVTLEPRIECATPLHVVHVAVPGASPSSVYPRVLVVASAGSRLTLVESFVSLGEGGYLTNAVTEIVAEADASVTHVKIQMEGPAGWHVAAVAGHQARGATIVSHNVSLGALLARNDIGSRLDGEGAECRLYGLYVADGKQHVDNHTWLDHAMPHCPSWEMYKGLLSGHARAVFCGRIHVREGAQKTDAKQSNRNLIVGNDALVYTRPQLTIHANDVKCTHGATIGRLDENALFYLRTRGIGAGEARQILMRAFADDLIDNIPVPAVRTALSEALGARLAAWS